jgi:uncharacterized protein (TIGR00730 family)
MTPIHSVAVFCGSRVGVNPAYAEAGRVLGRGLGQAGLRLVYGGGRVGIMGVVADAVLAAGGTVIGVIPEFLTKWEVAHTNVSEMIVTDSMHSRKRRLYEEADVFVVMPGGLGTYDEAIEVITWRQLRLHDKPILLCNVAGSVGPLVAAIDYAIEQGFADVASRGLFEVVEGVPAVMERLTALPAGRGAPAERM